MQDVQELALKGAHAIEYAQTPLQLSRRDGKLLRLVPTSERLSIVDLQQRLAAAFIGDSITCQCAAAALKSNKGRTKRSKRQQRLAVFSPLKVCKLQAKIC
jgi:hypothetical protein